ncbi:hypothetical protein EV359DRAFT_59893 [Lentinula novae-zelandiae]|nr:hypothetical protein EV359DRAFT_59893 [Lentinula novae-zelandiae]
MHESIGVLQKSLECVPISSHLRYDLRSDSEREILWYYFVMLTDWKKFLVDTLPEKQKVQYSFNNKILIFRQILPSRPRLKARITSIVPQAEDHAFIMQEARRIDSSGLEAKRRQEQVKFRKRLAEMNRQKVETRKKKAVDLRERLSKIPLISSLSELDTAPSQVIDPSGAREWTGKHYDTQIDALRVRYVDIAAKTSFKKVADKLEGLKAGFKLYLSRLDALNLPFGGSLDTHIVSNNSDGLDIVAEFWEEEEAEEEG